jgi:adenylate cyclase
MNDLFQELKRRKVFRVTAAYAVVAWMLIEIATVILPTFEAPQWVTQSIVLILILGFPIALVLAWAYEIGPDGIRADKGTVPEPTQSTETVELVSNAPMIVVLPFRARASDEVGLLTAEGLTDDITSLLTFVRDVKVAPRQAIARRLDPDDDGFEIARKLGG